MCLKILEVLFFTMIFFYVSKGCPCYNSGSCSTRDNGQKYCMCMYPYRGSRCLCLRDSCENNGTCDDTSNEVICNCIPGCTGDKCEICKQEEDRLTEESFTLTRGEIAGIAVGSIAFLLLVGIVIMLSITFCCKKGNKVEAPFDSSK